MQFQRLISPLSGLFTGKSASPAATERPRNVGVFSVEKKLPAGENVYGFGPGPSADTVLVGAGNPATQEGTVWIAGAARGEWERVALPDETAYLSRFVRLADGSYVAGGMTAIGRGAILRGTKDARTWTSVAHDLHPYSSIAALVVLADGSLLASVGQMITQGKTKPVLLRSTDQGVTWEKHELKLPISLFQSFYLCKNGTLYAGTQGDKDPRMYASEDLGLTWRELPLFPGYKTYKMVHVHVENEGAANERLLVILWGYKTDIADRVVRVYALDGDAWKELGLIDDSHFVFSFLAAKDGSYYVGSEKGRVYRSTDGAATWQKKATFPTNIGAEALYQEASGSIWLGKDSIAPKDFGLWRTQD